MADGRQYELADFDPSDGHLHGCRAVGACDCAAHLYAIAQDKALARPAAQWRHVADQLNAALTKALGHLGVDLVDSPAAMLYQGVAEAHDG